jgi:hypothetical protein
MAGQPTARKSRIATRIPREKDDGNPRSRRPAAREGVGAMERWPRRSDDRQETLSSLGSGKTTSTHRLELPNVLHAQVLTRKLNNFLNEYLRGRCAAVNPRTRTSESHSADIRRSFDQMRRAPPARATSHMRSELECSAPRTSSTYVGTIALTASCRF